MTDKPNHRGGRRAGAGRKPGTRTIPLCVKISAEAAEYLKTISNKQEYIDQLIIRDIRGH